MTASGPASPWVALALLLGAAILVVAISLRDARWETCARPELLADVLAIPGTRSTDSEIRKDQSGLLFEWRVGTIDAPVGLLSHQIQRSDRALDQSLNWSLKLQRPYQPTETWTERRSVDGEEVAIHWSAQPAENGQRYIVAHLDYVGGEPAASIFPTLLRRGVGQLFAGRLPLTMYIVEGLAREHQTPRLQQRATVWLEHVVRRNRRVCAS